MSEDKPKEQKRFTGGFGETDFTPTPKPPKPKPEPETASTTKDTEKKD